MLLIFINGLYCKVSWITVLNEVNGFLSLTKKYIKTNKKEKKLNREKIKKKKLKNRS